MGVSVAVAPGTAGDACALGVGVAVGAGPACGKVFASPLVIVTTSSRTQPGAVAPTRLIWYHVYDLPSDARNGAVRPTNVTA